jgi:competence CoiA-like predicted nuclease
MSKNKWILGGKTKRNTNLSKASTLFARFIRTLGVSLWRMREKEVKKRLSIGVKN